MCLQSGSLLAAEASVGVQSASHETLSRVVFSGPGLRHLSVRGPGQCAFNGHGGLHKHSLVGGERLVVDNGHVVAWSPDLRMEVDWAARGKGGSSSIFRSVASGEGLMCHFEGPGDVWVQTHTAPPPPRRSS